MKNNPKTNKELLNEELKRFESLLKYDESVGRINEMNIYLPEEVFMEDDLLEADGEEEETSDTEADNAEGGDIEAGNTDGGDTEGGDADIDAAIDDVAGELETDGTEEPTDSLGDDAEEPIDDLGGLGDLGGDEMEDTSDDVEIDVTELVNSTEEAKRASEEVNGRMSELMSQFDNLTSQLERMNQLSAKIDDLENQMEKRMPTPEEKLEMRSLSSYPYNVKLSDYWADKQGTYDVMGNQDDKKPKEYVLTNKDIESDYNERETKDSFNPYEEEDIF